MKRFDNVSYDPQANACYVTVHDDKKIVDSIVFNRDVVIDKDQKWDIVGVEIMNASAHYDFINKLLLSRDSIEACVSY